MWWNRGQSVWNTMRKQGKISAAYMWPGSDIPLRAERTPNHFVGYNSSIPFKERVDQVLKWMDLPHSQRPDLIALYSEEPDSTAHKTGPSSYNVSHTAKLMIFIKNVTLYYYYFFFNNQFFLTVVFVKGY